MNHVNRYKTFLSIGFGIIGFIGIFYATRFDFNGFSINFPWSLVLPLLITLAWGTKYGLISIVFGGVIFYPFILGSYNGWASLVPAISLCMWICVHGYGMKRRQQQQSGYYNMYFLQLVYSLLRLTLYLLLFPLLVQFNPPFWNPFAYTQVDMMMVLLFAVKGIIVESIFLALADAILLLPLIRRIFRLPISPGAKYNTRIMFALVGFGLLFTSLVLIIQQFIVDQNHPSQLLAIPDEKIKITFFMASTLFLIMGGITVRYVQRVLETQEALRIREAQYRQAVDDIRVLNNELEDRVTQRTFELQHAISELEAFSYTISHDLKAPLRAIDGYSQFITEDYGREMPGEARNMLDSIRDTSQDMMELINRLLEYAVTSKASLKKEIVDTRKMLTAIFHEFEIGNPDRQIELTLLENIPDIYVDKALFRQVCTNLVSNGIKFSSNQAVSRIEIGCVIDSDFYTFTFKDNGVGFDMKYADKLFGIFQRLHTKNEFEGVGIGLATVKKIVEKHGGSVRIEAIPGLGTTVFVSIPRVELE